MHKNNFIYKHTQYSLGNEEITFMLERAVQTKREVGCAFRKGVSFKA